MFNNYLKDPEKHTEDDDAGFAQSFEKMIMMEKAKEGDEDGNF